MTIFKDKSRHITNCKVYLIVLLCAFSIEAFLVGKPCDANTICEWGDWYSWQQCSSKCGGGMRGRTRSLCCSDETKHDALACLVSCNYTYSQTYQTDYCNEICYNGGTYEGYYCQCPVGYVGNCCEREAATSVQPEHLSTVKHITSKLTSIMTSFTTSDKNTISTTSSTASGIPCDANTICEWSDWYPWRTCSLNCSGGMRARQRSLCCLDELKHDPWACLASCNYTYNQTYQYDNCNEFCYNGGTYDGYSCQCPIGYIGECCEQEAATSIQPQHLSTVVHNTLKFTSMVPASTTSDKRTISTTASATSEIPCDGKYATCEWYDWSPWQQCSSKCGGGMRDRARRLCCAGETKHDALACLVSCNYTSSQTYQTDNCNEICYNGGTYDGYYCQCPIGYIGECCELEAATSIQPQHLSTAVHNPLKFTSVVTVSTTSNKRTISTTASATPAATSVTYKPPCRPLFCVLNCGNPPKYKLDENSCPVCECRYIGW